MEDSPQNDLTKSQAQQAPAASSAWSPSTHQAALYGGLRLVATVVQAHFRGNQARKRVRSPTAVTRTPQASMTDRPEAYIDGAFPTGFVLVGS